MAKAATKAKASSTKAEPFSNQTPAQSKFSPGRWAIIMKVSDSDDREEVIDIKQMAPGAKPELAADNENPENYAIEQVPDTVIIGMRRGGKFEAAGGFGWRDAEDKAARGNPVGSGATRIADAKAG